MKVTSITKKIISHYTHENVGVRSNLMRILGQGKLGGTGANDYSPCGSRI